MKEMNRNSKYKNKEDPGLHDGFQRMKSIGGKGAGVNRFMMNEMNPFKYPGVMHQPVHPVKISVMQEGHYREGQKEVQFSLLGNISIELCMF